MSSNTEQTTSTESTSTAPGAEAVAKSTTSNAISVLERKLESMKLSDDDLLKPVLQLRNLDAVIGSYIRKMPYELLLYICEFIEIVFNEELKKRLCEKQYKHDRETLGDHAQRSNSIQKGPALMKFLFGYFDHDPKRNCFLIFRHIHDLYCGFYEIGLRSLQTLALDVSITVDINQILARYPNLENFIITYCTRSSRNSMLEIEKTNHKFKKVVIPYYASQEMEHTAKLAEIFSRYPTIESLVLYNHRIGDEGARMLSRLPNIRYLDVSRNNITDLGAKYLFKIPSLRVLSVSHCQLTKEAFTTLVPGSRGDDDNTYAGEVNITDLNLTRVPLDTDCMQMLIQCSSLRKLTLGGVKSELKRSTYTTDVEVQPKLLEMLIGVNHIKQLNLRYNRAIGIDHSMKWLVENHSLREVNLCSCKLQTLPEQLASHPTLEVLDLSENILDDNAAQILSTMPRLKRLSMDDNRITDTACAHFASSQSLTFLSLNGHEHLTDVGVQQLLRSKTIEELSLRAVGMTDAGLKYIGENDVIKYLYCANTDIGDVTITERSLEYIEQNNSLLDFRLFGRRFIKFKQEFDSDQYDKWIAQDVDNDITMDV